VWQYACSLKHPRLPANSSVSRDSGWRNDGNIVDSILYVQLATSGCIPFNDIEAGISALQWLNVTKLGQSLTDMRTCWRAIAERKDLMRNILGFLLQPINHSVICPNTIGTPTVSLFCAAVIVAFSFAYAAVLFYLIRCRVVVICNGNICITTIPIALVGLSRGRNRAAQLTDQYCAQ
jgi:hypothetical protein